MKGRGVIEREYVLNNLEEELEKMLAENEDKTRRGGYFCLGDLRNGTPFPTMVVFVGELPQGKLQRCFDLCQEKMLRLASHPEHRASGESRDRDQGRYAGAIRVGDFIFSFSGLLELEDEELMLRLAVRTRFMNSETANAVRAYRVGKILR